MTATRHAPTIDRQAKQRPSRSSINHQRATVGAQMEVTCAFCGGRGLDPFGLMSPLSVCQVCGGAGHRTLPMPVVPCAFCHGTGVYPSSRMTCTTCMGVGHVHIPAETKPCPGCGGTGRAASQGWPDSPLSCGQCGGKGVVVP